MSLHILLPGCTSYEVLDTVGPLVGHVKKAIMTEFSNRFYDVDPDQLQLFKLGDNGCRILLDSTLTMGHAGLRTGTKLAVEYMATQAQGGKRYFLECSVNIRLLLCASLCLTTDQGSTQLPSRSRLGSWSVPSVRTEA